MQMKNWFKKALALTCAAIMCFGLVACNKPEAVEGSNLDGSNKDYDTKNLYITILHKGYGFEWLEALADGFEKANPGVTVHLNTVSQDEAIRGEMKAAAYTNTDLFFDIADMARMVQEYSSYFNNGQALRPLNDVLESKIPGENVTVGEKIFDSALTDYQYTDKDGNDVVYGLPYVTSALLLYYNETLINATLGEGNWEVPNTTDELIALSKRLSEKGVNWLVPGGLDQYSRNLFAANWAQWEGYENFMKFYDGIGFDSSKNRPTNNSGKIFEQPGRLESMKVMYDLLTPENGYVLKHSAQLSVSNLNDYQKFFVDSSYDYKLAFYPCGDWLMQEVKDNSGVTDADVIKTMRVPVTSSIINAYDSYSGNKNDKLPNINDDATLSAVIDYVDGNGELSAGVTDAEVEIVRSARSIVSTQANIHCVYAPRFSNAQTLANNFLIYMASDEGCKLFKENCIGGFAPYAYSYDDIELNATELTILKNITGATFVADYSYNDLFAVAGVRSYVNGDSGTMESYVLSPTRKYATAEALHQSYIDAYSGKKWDNYLSKIGK
ncbi:MAG: extracellular solute-binding protein [Clostridia bacterium]|nr:extracellular solute-binding protein [Clostridia bacterium]